MIACFIAACFNSSRQVTAVREKLAAKIVPVSLILLGVIVAGRGGEAAEAAARPNFVFIIADDLGWADVAFHGGNAPTPHLDQLVKEGVELTQHYVAPVCSPTRTGFLTGRFWSRFGVTAPQNERALPWNTVTLASALKSVGYGTCLTGKWHLGSLPEWGPNHYGFDHSFGSLAGGVGPWNHFYKTGPFTTTWHRDEKLIQQDGHVTDLIADEAVRWIESRGQEPFFLYVPFTAVHLPVKEPEEYLQRIPAGIKGEVPRHYAACVMHLDDAVGRIVSALDKAGVRDNTLLVFTSDNGGSTAENNDTKYPDDVYPQGKLPGNNRPLRGEKGQLYEGGIRVPTIVSWPGKLSSGKCDVPAHITDWTPTFTALAGYKPSHDLKWDGADIWTAIAGQKEMAPRTLYWVASGFRAKAVRVGDWKLIASGEGEAQKVELFDLASDPNETTDQSKQQPAKVEELLDQLQKISQRDRDAVANDPAP